MSRFIQSLLGSARSFLADIMGQLLAVLMFIVAGLAWLYFNTVYAVIPVLIIGVLIGGYVYGWVEGSNKKQNNEK
ncbi:hypothetical protein [Nitrincola sp.]|uniref:hypothetical protein n=1 Tax=Nitrincola sp. TaxID=1926584 RepID=UPI003A93F31B